MKDQRFISFLEKAQIWLRLLIETGSYIEGDDDYWKYFLVFEADEANGLSNFAGLLSYYKFKLSMQKERNRLSQLVILPQYQRLGLGYHLLNVSFFILQIAIL